MLFITKSAEMIRFSASSRRCFHVVRAIDVARANIPLAVTRRSLWNPSAPPNSLFPVPQLALAYDYTDLDGNTRSSPNETSQRSTASSPYPPPPAPPIRKVSKGSGGGSGGGRHQCPKVSLYGPVTPFSFVCVASILTHHHLPCPLSVRRKCNLSTRRFR